MTELSDALAGQCDSPPGFSRALLAAAGTVNHLVFCQQKSWLTCLRCKREIKRLQAVIEAVRPVIEEKSLAQFVDESADPFRIVLRRLLAGYHIDFAGRPVPEWMRQVLEEVQPAGRHAAHEEVSGG